MKPGAKSAYSARYKTWMLVLLLLVYACSFLDRIIVAVLGQAIKTDLKLSDFEMGLLGGLAFALLYVIAGVPFGRIAERRHRVGIISICVLAWSAFAALCGTAQSFWQLVLCRAGVGIGEAGGTPAAHSLINDHFPPERRATALATYALGVPLGVIIASFAGGWLAQAVGWRNTFVILAAPGVLLAALTYFTLREPPRGYADKVAVSDEVPSFISVLQRLWSRRAARNMIIATTIGATALQGINLFTPMYLGRVFGMGIAKAGFTFGIIIGVGGFVGISLGGTLSDWLSKRDQRWHAWVVGAATLLAVPVAMTAFLCSDATLATALIFVYSVLTMTWNGPTFSVVHRCVEPRMRASATAVLLLSITLIGQGVGPAAIGWLSDWFARGAFTGAGAFKAACVAGAAAPGPGTELGIACAKASATGIRTSMVCFSLIILAAAFQYFMAARTLREDVGAPVEPARLPELQSAVAESRS